MPGADRLRRGDRDIDLRETLPLETGGEGDQSGVVAHRECGDRGGVDPARQEGADRHVGAHMLGDRILEHRGDLVVTALLTALAGTGHKRYSGKPRREVAGHLRRLALS